MTSLRIAQPLQGMGLLEAVPEPALLAIAQRQREQGVNGRPNYVWDAVNQRKALGRFGWKANQPSLRQQNAGAALGDIGLTTAVFSTENCTDAQKDCGKAITGGEPEISDEFLEKLTLYTMTIAVPAQRNADCRSTSPPSVATRSMS